MKKLPLILLAGLFLGANVANAHGPVRQKLQEKISINAEPSAVWEKIKNYGDMSWLPSVAKTEADKGNDKGSVRVLTLKDGGAITEKLKKYDEKKMEYAYKITDMTTVKTINHSGKDEEVKVLPVSNYSASIAVKKGKNGGSDVIWKAAYYRAYMNNNPPPEMNEDAANGAVGAVLKAGLENLKKVVEGK